MSMKLEDLDVEIIENKTEIQPTNYYRYNFKQYILIFNSSIMMLNYLSSETFVQQIPSQLFIFGEIPFTALSVVLMYIILNTVCTYFIEKN